MLLVALPPSGTRSADAGCAPRHVAALKKEDYAAASKHFDATMKKVQPVDKFEALWRAILKQAGAFQKVTQSTPTRAGGVAAVELTCKFEKMELIIRVVFDKEDCIQGFFLRLAPPRTFPTPRYARPESFREEALTVGAGGDWPLPGTLTLPKGKGPFPVVVLLHGSGPNDRDETIGPNKPLRDLAWGLATRRRRVPL